MFIDLRRQRERALTLAEMSMAMAVGVILTAALMSFTVYAVRSFAAITNYVDLEQRSQNALDTLTRDVRQTDRLQSYHTITHNGRLITNKLVFVDADGGLLTYAFENKVLNRIKGTETKVLLDNVDFLSFQIYQRNPMNGTYDQYPTASAANCKLISVSWVCSRNILGHRLNTESVQTAKVIIRKQ